LHGRRRQRSSRSAQGRLLLCSPGRCPGGARGGALGIAAAGRPRRRPRALRAAPRREGRLAAARGRTEAGPTGMTAPAGKRLRREIRVRALLFGWPLLRLMPLCFGAALGWLAWYLVPRQRRLAREHLLIAFPEKDEAERDRIGRRSFANRGRAAVEAGEAHRCRPAKSSGSCATREASSGS